MSGGKRMRKPAAAKPAKQVKAIARPAEPAMDVAVGRRIRDLRRVRRLSLETVAERTLLSIGFLSQIERGLSSPSLRVLATLADVLGVGIAALFGASPGGDGASDQVVTRGLQRPELKLWRTGVSKQLLSPALDRRSAEAEHLLARWGRLHSVRSVLSGVALLLWGLHMVRSGIMRAFGFELRRVLNIALRNRLLALLAGIVVTALLQSSGARSILLSDLL